MIRRIILAFFILVSVSAGAQIQTQVIGDSIRLRANTGTTELILENSTKNVNGFLYNKGNGRTEFRSAMTKVNDSVYIIGLDTLKLSSSSSSSSGNNSWRLTGNAGTNPTTQFLGTTDNNAFVLKTNNQQRLSVLGDGTFNIAATDAAAKPLFRVYPNGDFVFRAGNNFPNSDGGANNGIRYNAKYGILEVGTNNNIDTTVALTCCSSPAKSAIIINSDFINTFKGHLHASIVGGDNITMDTASTLRWGNLFGESHYINGIINSSIVNGWGHRVYNGGNITRSIVVGMSHYFTKPFGYGLVAGYANSPQDTATYSVIGGLANKYGGIGQFISGAILVNKTPFGTALGQGNVDFTSLGYTGNRGVQLQTITDLKKYPIFAIGNSRQYNNPSYKSNAVTVLYNGRTQINTAGYDSNLVEVDVIPKAALEVVSKNSGILIPRLTSGQRDSIATTDLHPSLLLYNKNSDQFQYYGADSSWKSLGTGSTTSKTVQTLTDSSTVIWNYVQGYNRKVTLGGDRTLQINNVSSGDEGKIIIKQDGTGNRKIFLPANSFIENQNATNPLLSVDANSIDILSFLYDGTNYYWRAQNNLAQIYPTSRFNFSLSTQPVAGWLNLYGNPGSGLTLTDPTTGWTLITKGAQWGAYFSIYASNGDGGSSLSGPTYTSAFPYNAMKGTFINNGKLYVSGQTDYPFHFTNLPAGTYELQIMSSVKSSINTSGTGHFNAKFGSGSNQNATVYMQDNTLSIVTFTGTISTGQELKFGPFENPSLNPTATIINAIILKKTN